MASRGQPVCRKEDCSPSDIGLVYQTIGRFSAPEKLRYFQNIWKPDQFLFFLKRARLVESYECSGLNGSSASLGLFIRSTWMALFVYHAFVLEWSVGRMAIN